MMDSFKIGVVYLVNGAWVKYMGDGRFVPARAPGADSEVLTKRFDQGGRLSGGPLVKDSNAS